MKKIELVLDFDKFECYADILKLILERAYMVKPTKYVYRITHLILYYNLLCSDEKIRFLKHISDHKNLCFYDKEIEGFKLLLDGQDINIDNVNTNFVEACNKVIKYWCFKLSTTYQWALNTFHIFNKNIMDFIMVHGKKEKHYKIDFNPYRKDLFLNESDKLKLYEYVKNHIQYYMPDGDIGSNNSRKLPIFVFEKIVNSMCTHIVYELNFGEYRSYLERVDND